MNKITTLGIDIAKKVFQIACFNSHNKLISNKQYTRKKFIHTVSNLPPCLVGLEACGSAHYWAKYLSQQGHPMAQKLLCIPGIGPINTLACLILNPQEFRNGRHLAAYLGLVPRLTGTGGNTTVLGISRRGNTYHRYLLCHAARSILNHAHKHQDPLSRWASQVRQKRGFKIALVALANKLARIIYHVLQGKDYQPSLAAAV